jgi:DNA-binding GntR family transcriptional regulator
MVISSRSATAGGGPSKPRRKTRKNTGAALTASPKEAAKRTGPAGTSVQPADRAPAPHSFALEDMAVETMTDRVYKQIEELIVTLQLPPGTMLSEQALAQNLAFGRTPIREALQRLAREGLVTILARRGILVSEINLRTQLRLLEVRRELERLMARTACGRASQAEREEFAEIAEGMRQASEKADGIAFMRLDSEFNLLISRAAQNEFASRSMGLMHGLSRRFWYQHYKEVADLPRAAQLHAAVAQAIVERNCDEAGRASDRLLDYIEDFARKTLNN